MPSGRESKLTPELLQQLVAIISAGNFVNVACQFVGISETAYYNWVERGKRELARVQSEDEATGQALIQESEYIYVEFLESVNKARVVTEVSIAAKLKNAAMNGDVRAMTFYLERGASSGGWRKKDENYNLNVETKATVDLTLIPDDELKQLEAILSKAEIKNDDVIEH